MEAAVARILVLGGVVIIERPILRRGRGLSTVPLNKKQSGTSPSVKPWKYLVAATLKSKVQGTGTFATVLP